MEYCLVHEKIDVGSIIDAGDRTAVTYNFGKAPPSHDEQCMLIL